MMRWHTRLILSWSQITSHLSRDLVPTFLFGFIVGVFLPLVRDEPLVWEERRTHHAVYWGRHGSQSHSRRVRVGYESGRFMVPGQREFTWAIIDGGGRKKLRARRSCR